MIQAVMFDLDGTLTNTLEDIANAMNRALQKNGLPIFQVDEYRYLVGDGAKKLAERAVRECAGLAETVRQDYQAYYETHNLVTTKPYAGIPALLRALCDSGVKVCVLSNKPDADTCHVVRHFFPEIPFAAVRGQREGVPVKPNPAAALSIAEEIGVAPEDFLYLGDTSVDMTCAKRAGMHPVGVLWGFRPEKELRESGAEQLLDSPMNLMKMFKFVTNSQ